MPINQRTYTRAISVVLGLNEQNVRRQIRRIDSSITILKNSFRTLRTVVARTTGYMVVALNAVRRGVSGIAGAVGSSIGVVRQVATRSLIALGAAAAYSTVQAGSLEEALSQVQARSNASAEQMQALRNVTEELGATTRFTATEVAQGAIFLAQAGLTVEQSIRALPTTLQLATAGNLELAESADFVTNILGQFNLGVEELARTGDVLAKTANSTNTDIRQLAEALSYAGPVAATAGISLEEVSAAVGILSSNGIQATRAGRGLRGVLSSIVSPSDPAIDALKEAGVSVKQLNVESRGLIPVLKTLRNAQLDTGTLFRVFGNENASAAAILLRNADAVGTFTEELDNSQGALAAFTAIVNDNLFGAMRALKSAFQAAAINLGNALIPAVRIAVERLTEFFRGLADRIKGSQESISDFAVDLVTKAISAVERFGNFAKNVFYGVRAAIIALRDDTLSVVDVLDQQKPPEAPPAPSALEQNINQRARAFAGSFPGTATFEQRRESVVDALPGVNRDNLAEIRRLEAERTAFAQQQTRNREIQQAIGERIESFVNTFQPFVEAIVNAVRGAPSEDSGDGPRIGGILGQGGVIDTLSTRLGTVVTKIEENSEAIRTTGEQFKEDINRVLRGDPAQTFPVINNIVELAQGLVELTSTILAFVARAALALVNAALHFDDIMDAIAERVPGIDSRREAAQRERDQQIAFEAQRIQGAAISSQPDLIPNDAIGNFIGTWLVAGGARTLAERRTPSVDEILAAQQAAQQRALEVPSLDSIRAQAAADNVSRLVTLTLPEGEDYQGDQEVVSRTRNRDGSTTIVLKVYGLTQSEMLRRMNQELVGELNRRP